MTKEAMISLIKENPRIKFSHTLFGDEEFIYGDSDGNVYDECGYLFEDWVSEGVGAHNGIRMRTGSSWEYGWMIIIDRDTCRRLSLSDSGKELLYNEYCKTCSFNRKCGLL